MPRWPDSLELLRWTPVDPWTLEKAVAGVLILGATRSGKTSGPFQYVIRSFLRAGFGGVFFCVKTDSAEEYEEMVAKEGREGDIIKFGPDHPHRFNFLTDEATRYGSDKAIVENVVQTLLQASEALSRKYGHKAGDDYFENAMKQLLRHCFEVLITARGEINLRTLLDMVQTLPRDLNEAEEESRDTAFTKIMREAEATSSPERKRGVSDARKFFTLEWPGINDRTRTSTLSSLTVLLDCFLRYPLYELFGQTSTVTPADVLNGKILIVDVPIKKYFDFGKIAAVLWKTALQRAVDSRKTPRGAKDTIRPIFFAGDECQYFATSGDTLFATTCASAKGILVYATQNLELLMEEMGGGGTGRASVNALLGNLQNRLVCQVSDPQTTQWFAETIGKVLVKRTSQQEGMNWSAGGGGGSLMSSALGNFGWNQSESTSEQIDYDMQPRELTVLKKGRAENGLQVEAIVTCAGDIFRANGKTWKKVTFHQSGDPGFFSSGAKITVKRM